MRRTTICRSDAAVLTALLVCALAVPAAAQQTNIAPLRGARTVAQDRANQASAQTIRQEQEGQQAEGQQPTQPNAPAMQGQRVQVTGAQGGQQPQGQAVPATHTIVEGETLWALAQRYLNDPMLWPEIYRLNTDVVEDPHWIYPGEVLRLTSDTPPPAAADTTAAQAGVVVDQGYAAAPVQDSLHQQTEALPAGRTIFFPAVGAAPRRDAVEVREARAYRAVRQGEYYSAGFLTEGQPLPSGHIMASYETTVLGNIQTRQTANLFEDVLIDEPPGGDSLLPGDLLLTYRRGDEVADFGEVIRPTGMLRVVGRVSYRYRATVVAQYTTIAMGQEYIRVAPFSYNTNRRPEPVTDGVQAMVVALRDPRVLLNTQDVVFLDKGADDGVQLGDVFRLYLVHTDQVRGGSVEQDQGMAMIVNVRSRSATAVIVELYRGDIRAGSHARQVRRMPT